MSTLTFTVWAKPEPIVVEFNDRHEIDSLLFLIENSALHFLPDMLSNHLRFMIEAVAQENSTSMWLHCRQVRTLFDALSQGMVPQLQELRYNVKNPRMLNDPSDELPHQAYYRAQTSALLLQARLLPLVIHAAIEGISIEVSYKYEVEQDTGESVNA